MTRIEIQKSLVREIKKRFDKAEAHKIIDFMQSLEDNPHKGKALGTVGGILIKELKYKSFRFYFLADGFKLKCLREEDLTDLLLRFVRMSDKKHHQEVIEGIKRVLKTIGRFE